MITFVRKNSIVLLLLISSALPASATGETDIHINSKADSLVSSLPDIVTAAFQESGLPSLSMALVYDRDIVYSQALGYADLEKKIPATTGTVYPIASITKVFVATMLVQLAEEGVVTLDTPVKDLLPEYRIKSPYKGTQPTVLRQLATHTAGLPRDANINFWSDYTAGNWLISAGSSEMKWYASTEQVLANLPYIELEYPPNSRYSYSNLGMMLLGVALERAAGIPFTEYIESRILKPLGMNNSGFLLHRKQPSRVPTGYVYLDAESEPLTAPEWELGGALYSGGLYSTAEDMTRFLSLQFRDAAPGGPQIVSPDGLRMMHLESIGWGTGWGRYITIEHTGGHLGFYACIKAIPALKIGIVALTNSNNPLMPENPAHEIAGAILEGLKQAILSGSAATDFDAGTVDLTQYVGRYSLPGAEADIEIELRNGQLLAELRQDSTFSYPMSPVGINEFGIADDAEPWFFFQCDNVGEITSLRFMEFTFKRIQ